MIARTLILMQGVPGSGKSTVARKLLEDTPEWAVILSTDDFWGADYKFDAAKLGEAHRWNQRSVAKALASDVRIVIVDNTNIKRRDAEPYLALAQMFEYIVQVVRVQVDIKLALERNTHNVPEDVICRMANEMEDLLPRVPDKSPHEGPAGTIPWTPQTPIGRIGTPIAVPLGSAGGTIT